LAPNSALAARAHGARGGFHDDIIHPGPIPFALVHLACLAAIWTGVTAEALAIGVATYAAHVRRGGGGLARAGLSSRRTP
jgi:hypothetical protein